MSSLNIFHCHSFAGIRWSLKAPKALEIPHVRLHSDSNAAFSPYVTIEYGCMDLHRGETENTWWMFIRAPADGERYTWATMGEAAAGNLQEHTGLKTYPKGGGGKKERKKKKKDKKDKAVKREKYRFWPLLLFSLWELLTCFCWSLP